MKRVFYLYFSFICLIFRRYFVGNGKIHIRLIIKQNKKANEHKRPFALDKSPISQ